MGNICSPTDITNITITTPMGDCNIPIDKSQIKGFIKEVMKDSEENTSLFESEVIEFIDLESMADIDGQYEWWEENESPAKLHDLMDYIDRDYEIIHSRAYSSRQTRHTSISYKQFDFPKGSKNLPIKATFFIKDKNGVKFVIDINPVDGLSIEFQVMCDPNISSKNDFIDGFNEYFNTNGVLKNAKFDAKLSFLKYDDTGWDEIVLTENQRKLLDRNIIKYSSNLELYEQKGLPTSRGCLITGPPGTGKTLCCNILMSQMDCTFIYITSDTIQERGQIGNLYDLARSLSPTVIVIEDIDTLGAIDRQHGGGDHPLLGEFLNCLAGVEKNNGVITIATTNFPKHLDRALVDRPGRFDLRLDFGLPDKELRETIFKKYLEGIKDRSKIDYNKLATLTDGMTGAHLKEIVMLSYTQALEDADYCKNTKVSYKGLLAASQTLISNREKYQYQVKKESEISAMHL
jgi:AAA+ superfamily predicted ATPase